MQKDILEVQNILEKHMGKLIKDYNIKLMYIFGSYSKGSNRINSDLDIAVYIEGETNYLIKLDILYDLVGILNRDDIDLVILNNVNEILKFQVIKYGKIIYMENLYTKVTFESSVMKEYMDKEHFRNTQNKYSHDNFLKQMKKG
ncbi:type VII toxin-antitoxin system MntA family adenylyltransferase antitoxin [Tissierella creatinophila]|uniref:Nucleotidyltransferase domain protein n=1 Tax=Tissierella creatinophila DSM 6911 TaxID=1123403 RepID=A0A1U7M2K6_TISCR|nr:nucleotidyltransferase domain-containing protein [Tissierella creatinophila]OLS01552.1 nucleotidyltransferase domain protein [Tissierella creatinophila DSM 6911]